jgi:hypothetical protein
MEAKVIIVSVEKSNKSENNVWAVAITGEEQKQAYCKSAWKAMKFAFMLKKQTGFYIEDESLHMLSEEIAKQKAEAAAKAEAEKPAEQEVQPGQQPEAEAEAKKEKKARKPRTKKVQAEPVLAQAAEAAGLIAFM